MNEFLDLKEVTKEEFLERHKNILPMEDGRNWNTRYKTFQNDFQL